MARHDLGAHVPAPAAVLMVRLGVPGSLREASVVQAERGEAGFAVALRYAADQIEAAARAFAASDDGSSEVLGVEDAAGSGVVEISTSEAAERLGFRSSRQVVRMLGDGVLAGRRVGRTWLVDVASVEARRAG